MLRITAGIELGTLTLLLTNLLTRHLPEISRTLGPIHGLAYIGTIICAGLIANGRHRIWLFALIPGIGGILAARTAHAPSNDPGQTRLSSK